MKIRLNLEALAVESFETSAAGAQRGTVHGNACSEGTCYQIICDITNGGEQNGTCDYSCGDPCATNVNCSGGTGGTGGGLQTRDLTCATGFQIQCSCP